MTQKEKIIATAYTGIMFVDGSQLGDVYAYEEEKLGHGVIDIMHASKDFNTKVRDAVKPDFIAMLKGELQEPIDEEELDKLANEYACKYSDPYTYQRTMITCGFKSGYLAALEYLTNNKK